MEIANGLSLREHPWCAVVRYGKSLDLHLGTKPLERKRNPARLVHIHLDADRLNPHVEIVPSQTSRICTYRRKVSNG